MAYYDAAMSRLIARLILAMLILPVSGALFVFLFFVFVIGPAAPTIGTLLFLWGTIYLFVAAYWLLLWRSLVRWTPTRILYTTLATTLAPIVGVLFGIVLPEVTRGLPREPAALVAGGTVPIIWVLATVLIWRETSAERIDRLAREGRETVSCPNCGYNLTGLSEARCPECGSRFTLDQLVRAQPHHDATLPHD
jgi:hypothetical protein